MEISMEAVWKLCGKIVYGSYAWKSCMEALYGHFVWKSCVEIMYGNHVWKEILYGNRVWNFCMEIVYGSWRPKLVTMFAIPRGTGISRGRGNRLEGTGGTARSWLQPPALKKLSENPLGKPS